MTLLNDSKIFENFQIYRNLGLAVILWLKHLRHRKDFIYLLPINPPEEMSQRTFISLVLSCNLCVVQCAIAFMIVNLVIASRQDGCANCVLRTFFFLPYSDLCLWMSAFSVVYLPLFKSIPILVTVWVFGVFCESYSWVKINRKNKNIKITWI